MNELRAQVERFYRDIWNRHDKSAIPSVLQEEATFRGSLGEEKKGHVGFSAYLDGVHDALGGFECIIEDIAVDPPRVFARMLFTGIHRGSVMGYKPTQERISWAGAAFFTFWDGRVSDLWVLGDLKGLETQLKERSS